MPRNSFGVRVLQLRMENTRTLRGVIVVISSPNQVSGWDREAIAHRNLDEAMDGGRAYGDGSDARFDSGNGHAAGDVVVDEEVESIEAAEGA